MNVERAREVFPTAYENFFAVIEQLWMPHINVCQFVKASLHFQLAGSSLFVDFVYEVLEMESLILVFF